MRLFNSLRENFSLGMKVFANQIGIAIFSLVLYTAVGSMSLEESKESLLFILISAASLVFYVFLVYNVVWEIGAKDRIRVDGGRAEREPCKGLVIALAADLPNLIVGGISLLLGVIAYLTESAGVKIAYGIFRVPTQLGLAGYMGIVATAFPATEENVMYAYMMQSMLYFVLPLILFPLLFATYRLGYANKRVLWLPPIKNARR